MGVPNLQPPERLRWLLREVPRRHDATEALTHETFTFCSLRPEPFRELDAWVAAYRRLWEERLDRFAKALDRKQKTRSTSKETT